MTLGTRLERLRTKKIIRIKVKLIYFAIGCLLHVNTLIEYYLYNKLLDHCRRLRQGKNVPIRVTKAYSGSGGTALLILNLGTRWS